mgnify:FL=1
MADYSIVEHKLSDNSFAYKELVFDSWEYLKTYLLNWDVSSFSKYVFRGHADAKWKLEPTIERYCTNDGNTRNIIEKNSIAMFQKGISIFATDKDISFLNVPEKHRHLDWLALMQHHGAATRLLDFSDSPFVASFFAMANLHTENKEKCIWAIPLQIIDDKNRSNDSLKYILEKNTLSEIYSDIRLDKSNYDKNILGYSYLDMQFERLFRQQGCFIYSLSKQQTFESLLKNYFDDETLALTPILKLSVKAMSRTDIGIAIKDLKQMNITYSSLFPDIDGFSKDILTMQYINNI